MKLVWFVFLGGGLGSVARYGLQKLNALYPIPVGTLAANLMGSFIVGLVIGFVSRFNSPLTPHQSAFMLTGFCGGFTTFSAFSYENYLLLKSGNYSLFIPYYIGSIILGLAAVFLGIWAAREL